MLFKENEPRVHERPDPDAIQQWQAATPPPPNYRPQTYRYPQPMVHQTPPQQPYPGQTYQQPQEAYFKSVNGRMVRVPAPPVPYQQQYHPGYAPMVHQQVVVQRQPRGTNHGLHIILSLLTAGLWIPVWLIVWAANGR